ncbi:2-amino-5-chloromuconic acid deaminase [bioreactor metagenome]|uniref:2-amino-5-chloromuconic acid deaminase n=1 Tax=bioreactor metagenome TaxID=1076179 RepID=A0A645F9L4_9ZZZZ
MFTQADAAVLDAFEQVASALSRSGARVGDVQLDDWMSAPSRLQENGTLIAAEAAYIHAATLASQPQALDPLVLSRIRRGESIPAAHYVGLQQARDTLKKTLDQQIADLDVLMLPTVPLVAPRIDALADDAEFVRVNMLMLRNTSVFNFYDLPAMSLPIQVSSGGLPVGLMVVGRRGCDRDLLAIGAALQSHVALLR